MTKTDLDYEVYMLQCDFKRYNGIKKSINRLINQINEIDYKMTGMASKGNDGVPGTRGNPYVDNKNQFIVAKSRLQCRLKKERLTLNILNDYLKRMVPEDRKIIVDYYINHKTLRKVGEDNNYSKSSIERNIKAILKKVLQEC
jgi:DNA-directed RNA polymerase specialized sigma subunit